MAQALKPFFLILLATLAGLVQAQVPRDPTQPPAAFTVKGEAVESDMAGSEPPGRVLQSIIRRHGARPVAIINGETVAIGGKVDDMVLVNLTDNEARLKGPAGIEVLMLSPTDGKKPVRTTRPEKK